MIKEANKRFSGQKFLLGDAEALPFDSASFDVALCSFGLMHMAYPDRAISEACRILKAGGRYVFTVWTAPERARFFALVNDAVNRYGDIGVRMPPAPPMFRFAERAECARTLAEFGFSKVQFQELPLTWRPASTTEFLDYIYKSSVRMPLLLAPQKPWMLRKIHAAIMEGASAFLIDGKFEVPWPALMVCGTKLST
jgi:ubiquinone/menaquinone biosynthesis C-methylase UbiE